MNYTLLLCWFWLIIRLPAGEGPPSLSHTEKPFPPSPISDADSIPYSFIRLADNKIGRPNALNSFTRRLQHLEKEDINRVRIVHIGDSHVQADLWTGRLRAFLQDRFGAAGRGLVFPLELANTPGQLDVEFSSVAAWESRKSVFKNRTLPLGLSGITLRSTTPGASFRMTLLDRFNYGHHYDFDRATLYHGDGENYQAFLPGTPSPDTPAFGLYTVRSGDTLYGIARRFRCTVDDLRRWNHISGNRIKAGQPLKVKKGAEPGIISPIPTPVIAELQSAHHTRFTLPAPARALDFRQTADDRPGTIYGLVLDNARKTGILYHAVGVNGVTYYHYNRAELFWDQLESLSPDLVVVSLGTNEALAGGFETEAFRKEVRQFLTRMQNTLPQASFLLTTNPDVLRQKKHDNPNNLKVRQILLESAAAFQTGYWDLHDIMGGAGSIRRWREAGLAHTDFIHFTKEGYWLQARLLYQALMKNYDAASH